MYENLPRNGSAVGVNESTDIQTTTALFDVSWIPLGLTEVELVLGFVAAAVLLCVFAWFFERLRDFVSRCFQATGIRLLRSTGRRPALAESGRTPRISSRWLPEVTEGLSPEKELEQAELLQLEEEAPVDESLTSIASDVDAIHESLLPARQVPEFDLDTTHQNWLNKLAESKQAETKARSELEAAEQSLESQTAEVTRLDQELANASHDFASHGDNVGELESKNRSLEAVRSSLQEKLDKAEAELAKQSGEISSLQSALETHEKESAGLKEQASLSKTLDAQVVSLTQELAQRSSDFDQLKIASTEAENKATLNASSLEESQKHSRQLADQLADSKQLEEQARSELEQTQQSLKSLAGDLKQATQDLERKEETADLLHKEKAAIQSDLETLDEKLTAAVTESKQLAQGKSAVEKDLQSEKDRHRKTKDAFDSANQKIKGLEEASAASQTAFDQSTSEHAAAIKVLQVKVEDASELAAKTEAQHKKVCLQFESKIAESDSELVSLKREAKAFESEIAELTDSAAKADVLSEQLAVKAQELEALDAARVEYETKLDQTESQLATFDKRAQESELKLSETLELLADEQASAAALKKELADHSKENSKLADQLAKHSELEASFASLNSRHEEAEQRLSRLAAFEEQAEKAELKLSETLELLAKEQSLSAKLEKEVAGQSKENANLADQLAKHSELEASFASLSSRHEGAEQNLARVSAEFDQERTLHAKLQKVSAEGRDELQAQTAKCQELEKQTSGLQKQLKDAERKLKDSAKDQKQHVIRLEETNQKLSADLDRQTTEHAKLKAQLDESSRSDSDELQAQTAKRQALEERANGLQKQLQESESRLAASTNDQNQEMVQLKEANQRLSADLESQLREASQAKADNSLMESKLEQQKQKLTEIQAAFEKENSGRADLVASLDAKTTRINELETRVSRAVDNEANADKLARKLRNYKLAHQKNKEYLETLSSRGAKMQERASEYLKAAKILKSELNAQRKVSAKLQRMLDAAKTKPAGVPDKAELDRLVQQAARRHVMSLKSQFEERIKKKNKALRELRKQLP